jgi:hypothetical protein
MVKGAFVRLEGNGILMGGGTIKASERYSGARNGKYLPGCPRSQLQKVDSRSVILN